MRFVKILLKMIVREEENPHLLRHRIIFSCVALYYLTPELPGIYL